LAFLEETGNTIAAASLQIIIALGNSVEPAGHVDFESVGLTQLDLEFLLAKEYTRVDNVVTLSKIPNWSAPVKVSHW
jgi:hypothetical protein